MNKFKKKPIQVKRVTRAVQSDNGKLTILNDVSFDVDPGEFVCIVGPTGNGKSTLLRILAGIEDPSEGAVLYKPENIGFVFQTFALFPWLSVEQNIAFGLKMNNLTESQINTRVQEEVHRLGLRGFEHVYPRELSNGMKQRVGIARALAVSPELLILDEPLSSLDEMTAKQLRTDLLTAWDQTGVTVVMVTHLIEEAVQLADKIVVMSPRPGRVDKIISNKLSRPRNLRTSSAYKLIDEIESLI